MRNANHRAFKLPHSSNISTFVRSADRNSFPTAMKKFKNLANIPQPPLSLSVFKLCIRAINNNQAVHVSKLFLKLADLVEIPKNLIIFRSEFNYFQKRRIFLKMRVSNVQIGISRDT